MPRFDPETEAQLRVRAEELFYEVMSRGSAKQRALRWDSLPSFNKSIYVTAAAQERGLLPPGQEFLSVPN